MGRPTLPRKSFRGIMMNFKVNAGERKAIIDAATRAGTGYSAWIRGLCLQAAGYQPVEEKKNREEKNREEKKRS